MISRGKSIIFIIINLDLKGHARPKLFGSGKGKHPSPSGIAALPGPRQFGQESDPRLMDPSQNPMLLDLASSPKCNEFELQSDPLKLIVIINIKNIIICIIINIVNIKNIIMCYKFFFYYN